MGGRGGYCEKVNESLGSKKVHARELEVNDEPKLKKEQSICYETGAPFPQKRPPSRSTREPVLCKHVQLTSLRPESLSTLNHQKPEWILALGGRQSDTGKEQRETEREGGRQREGESEYCKRSVTGTAVFRFPTLPDSHGG